MDDAMMWSVITGFLSATFVLPMIQQPRWSEKVRAAVTFGYCVVVGLGAAYLTGAFDRLNDVRAGVSTVLMVLISAIASYKGFAKPIGIAERIENATSGGPAPPAG